LEEDGPQARGYKSLNENLPRAAPHMSILRKIYLREMGSSINQGADALDRFESDSRNILRTQPF
jgi:hypothetical protein